MASILHIKSHTAGSAIRAYQTNWLMKFIPGVPHEKTQLKTGGIDNRSVLLKMDMLKGPATWSDIWRVSEHARCHGDRKYYVCGNAGMYTDKWAKASEHSL